MATAAVVCVRVFGIGLREVTDAGDGGDGGDGCVGGGDAVATATASVCVSVQ